MSLVTQVAAPPVVNAMTVDVEDWFQVQAFAHCIPHGGWDSHVRRVEANVDRILAMFDAAKVRATFFTLGWIAERHPAMVRRIVAGGHELASHGWEHIRANTQDPATFRADVERTRLTLEDIGGVPVSGYRAATFSINAGNLWAFRVLQEAGYVYSSSINPIRHDLYGMPDAPRTPFQPEGGALWEIPMTTVAAFGRNWPCAGGGFFRLLPYLVYRSGLAAVNRREQMAGIFYFHPWEIDPGQPRVADCGWKSRVRHYTNLSRMQSKLERVLREFAWDRMDRVFGDLWNDQLPLPLRAWAAERTKVGGRGACASTAGADAPLPQPWSAPRPKPSRGGGVRQPRQLPPPDPRAMPLQVRTLDDASAPAWDAFVNAMPDGTFFHRAAWARVIEAAFGHRTFYRFTERDGAITGVLPLAQVKTLLFGNTLVSTPFCVYGGVLAADADSAAALEAHAASLLRSTGAGAVELRDRAAMAAGSEWVGRPDLYVTFRKPIEADHERNMKAIPRKQRAMVRKGIQYGLTSVSHRDTMVLHRAYAESVRNLGTPVFSRRYFDILMQAFGDEADIVTVLDDGQPIAAVMNFYFRDEVLPYYGGGTAQARHRAGNDFMYWEVMRRAADRGNRLFDFGRSKVGTGAHAFKHNWGFIPAPLPYRYLLAPGATIPDHNPLNPKYRLFIAAWKRLPLPVANLLGPPIVRGLG